MYSKIEEVSIQRYSRSSHVHPFLLFLFFLPSLFQRSVLIFDPTFRISEVGGFRFHDHNHVALVLIQGHATFLFAVDVLAKFIRACLLINVNETIGSRHFDKKMLIDKERPREIRDLLMISGVFLLIPKNIYFFPFFFPSIEKIVNYNKYMYIYIQ